MANGGVLKVRRSEPGRRQRRYAARSQTGIAHEQDEQFEDEHPEQPEPPELEAPLNLYPTEKPHADIFFLISLLPHFGQAGSSLAKTRSSKSSLHAWQLYS